MKKRQLALMLVVAMVMGMSMTTMAEGEPFKDMSTVTITKTYNATNPNTTSPAETFSFTELKCAGVKDAAVDVTKDNAPVPTIASVEYAAGDAGTDDNATKTITITLPEYTGVGIYTYTFSEVEGGTAGVTYYGEEITLVVTVIEQNGKVRVAAVHTEGEDELKSDDFENEYSAGSLTVGKTVTGILGDKTKDFTVKVTFNAPEGKTVKEAITYVDGTETKTIAADWAGQKDADITLKDNESVTFTNIPYGVTYTVVENDYTAEADGGYDAAVYKFDDENKTIDSASENVQITNNKGGEVDTGIFTTNMPYILALVAIAAVAVAMFRRKREF